MGLLNFQDIFKLNVLKFYFKLKNETLPHYLQNMFTAQHEHNTRTREMSIRPVLKMSSSQCLKYILPAVVDNTPNIILEKVHTHSPKGFTNYVKRYYLSQYDEVCYIVDCYICNR